MFTKSFWKDACERSVRTMAQSAVGLLTVDVTGLLDADWIGIGSATGLAGIISVLMSLAATGQGAPTNASFLGIDPNCPTDPPGKHAVDRPKD